MRKLVYLLLLLGGCSWFSACEEEAKNPGDFSLKTELKVLGATTTSGKAFDLNVLRTIDSTYVRFTIRKDTLKDSDGTPIKDPNGKLTITDDTTFYKGRITAKFIEMKKVVLDSSLDTVLISLESNAKWMAPMPSGGGKAQWFFTQRLAGGGDGTIVARVVQNKETQRAVDAVQYVLTSDSAVMYKLVFGQKGEKD